MKKFMRVIGLALLSVILVTGCSSSEETSSKNSSEGFVLEYPKHLKEKFGESIKLDKVPEKIVIMTTTPVLSLHELGVKLDTVPENESVKWPEDLNAKKVPVEMTVLDTESIIASKPDLLILSEHSAQQYKKVFEDNKIPVYYTSAFKNIEIIKEELGLFAKAFNKESEHKKILERFTAVENKIKEVSDKLEAKKTLVISGYPLKYVQNKDGYVGQMASLFKSENIIENAKSMAGMSPINMEEIVEKNPEIIIAVGYANDEKEVEENYKKEFDKSKDVWNKVDAVKKGNIIYLDKSFQKSAGIKIIEHLEVLSEKFSKGVVK